MKQQLEKVDFNPIPKNTFIQDIITRHRSMPWLSDRGMSCICYQDIPHEFLKRLCERKKNKLIFDEEMTKLEFLVHWFKHEFFEWFDKPICKKCRIPTKAQSSTPPNAQQKYLIENYKCEKCERAEAFPRYNDPEKLRTWRKGRCGEWGISFTHMCLALELDARIVYDETDHVWTEVYIKKEQRWVHCDPCEGVIDAPLIYEAGWNKKLSYVIAYSKDEVQDVTWRYSSRHAEVLGRRNFVREEELAKFLADYRVACLAKRPESKQLLLIERF